MKNFTTSTRVITLILAASILLTSCASTTLIDSVPSGSELYLNGEFAGVTPYTMTDTKLIGTCTTVRIEKENFENYYGTICRTEEADPGAIIGGIFFFFPFFWAMKYKPTHFYKLQPKSGNTESLDELWNSESNEKSKKMSVEKPTDNPDGIIKLDQGNEITPEEFEKQKSESNE